MHITTLLILCSSIFNVHFGESYSICTSGINNDIPYANSALFPLYFFSMQIGNHELKDGYTKLFHMSLKN